MKEMVINERSRLIGFEKRLKRQAEQDEIIDGFIQQGRAEGRAESLVKCVENLMKYKSITASEACEMMGCSLSEYEEALLYNEKRNSRK